MVDELRFRAAVRGQPSVDPGLRPRRRVPRDDSVEGAVDGREIGEAARQPLGQLEIGAGARIGTGPVPVRPVARRCTVIACAEPADAASGKAATSAMRKAVMKPPLSDPMTAALAAMREQASRDCARGAKRPPAYSRASQGSDSRIAPFTIPTME